jgi:hypothetical protein
MIASNVSEERAITHLPKRLFLCTYEMDRNMSYSHYIVYLDYDAWKRNQI